MAQTVRRSDDRIVIAVDFGTTFSGVAYAFNSPGKKPEVVSILDWPGKFKMEFLFCLPTQVPQGTLDFLRLLTTFPLSGRT